MGVSNAEHHLLVKHKPSHCSNMHTVLIQPLNRHCHQYQYQDMGWECATLKGREIQRERDLMRKKQWDQET